MTDISISDKVQLTADAQISDDSPLALANLKHLSFSNLPIVSDFTKPINRFPLVGSALGLGLEGPSALIGNSAHLGTTVAVNGSFSICTPQQGTLFEPDGFAPEIEIKQDECWVGLSIDVSLNESLGVPLCGAGVSVGVGAAMAFGTFVKLPLAGGGPAMPSFKEGLTAVLQRYAVPHSAEQIRAIPVGVAHTAETTGTISLGASYSAPLEVNPLATLNLPLNLSLSVAPAAHAAVRAAFTLEGSFVLRVYRVSETSLIFGLFKKKQTTLNVSLSASAGVEVKVQDSDVLSGVLSVVVPPADLSGLHLDAAQEEELRAALNACVDQSVALSVNASCSASAADEAAVVYELDLSRGDTGTTDLAITGALRGDWSLLDTLENAKPIRSIVRELKRRRHKLTVNLLGLYNATSLSDYLHSTSFVHDEHGQIALIDKATAKSISAGTTPFAAKADKLRSALAEAFMATVTYSVSAGKLGIVAFNVRQSLLEYHIQANAADITRQVLLARAVGLATEPSWDSILRSNGSFGQNRFYIDVQYDVDLATHLFYQDVAARTAHPAATLDRMGRNTKIALLDPSAANSTQRRMALSSDSIWDAMNECGNMAAFKSIPGIAKLTQSAIGSIAADWSDVRSWSNAMQDLTPRLTSVLKAIEESKAANPLADGTFLAAHKELAKTLAGLTSKTHSAFGDGWDLAVMYRLAVAGGAAPPVQMDIGWNKQFEHYQSGVPMALGQTSGA